MNKINFENKYLVLKWDDIRVLTPDNKSNLVKVLNEICRNRSCQGKKNNDYLVINADESYAYQVAGIMKQHGHYSDDGVIEVAQ